MEKRFVLFLGLSLGILVGYSLLARMFMPPPEVVENEPADPAEVESDETTTTEGPKNDEPTKSDDAEPTATTPAATTPDAEPAATAPESPDEAKQTWMSFGSYAAASGHSLLVTFNSQGAAIERVELTTRDSNGKLKYRNLEDKSGYLGHLALVERPDGAGCRVNIVGDGTPAAMAGVLQDDVILSVDGTQLDVPETLLQILADRKAGDSLALQVERSSSTGPANVDLTATLGERPLELIRPEPLHEEEFTPHPLSFLVSLTERSSGKSIQVDSPKRRHWTMEQVEEGVIECRLQLAGSGEQQQPLELVKRYRLGALTDFEETDLVGAYHIDMDLELVNSSDAARKLSYTLHGPTGLPLEGWWYSAKIHPKMFYGAGARDVLIHTDAVRRLVGCPEIYKKANKTPEEIEIPLFADDEPVPSRTLQYIGVDTQYFTAAVMPRIQADSEGAVFSRADAFAVGDVKTQPKGYSRTTNTSFTLDSTQIALKANANYKQSFRLFLGPKDPEVLDDYALDDVIYYGWFAPISRILKEILHFFYNNVGNFGIAIILLTVVVRGCMFPISRKAAKNAAMMQELAPEMRKLTEKYKGDMEKRAKAQQELFRKHNYNPFGGCWLMFLQLPIFLGLYRCIAVDIELRQAPLIPGVEWCANLAGPDQLLFWKNFMFLSSETSMLGPYLNVLPLITVSLFLVHQKLFTPPATDEQSAMQLKMMKYMTLFMGFLFFKVAAGLCLYFIASSLWGIAERKLVPKPKVKLSGVSSDVVTTKSVTNKKEAAKNANGLEEKKAARKKRNKRR